MSKEIQIKRLLKKLKATIPVDRKSIKSAIKPPIGQEVYTKTQVEAKNHHEKFLQQKLDEEEI